MARTSHTVRSASCSRCHVQSATLRCNTCQCAYYCRAQCCSADFDRHKFACSQVHDARERIRRLSSPPPLEVLVAISDLVAVVQREAAKVQQSSADSSVAYQSAAAGEQTLPRLCPISEPPSPTGSPSAQLSVEDALWLPSTAAAALHYLEFQAPGLLHSAVSDLLLDATCCVRDAGQDCSPHLVAWAVLERCLTGGLRQFRDTLALETVMERWVLDGAPECTSAECGTSSAASSASSVDSMMTSFPMMSLETPGGGARESSGCGGGAERGAEGGARRAASLTWVPSRTAEVLRMMAPLTVTVHHDLPLLSRPLEIDMCLFCRV